VRSSRETKKGERNKAPCKLASVACTSSSMKLTCSSTGLTISPLRFVACPEWNALRLADLGGGGRIEDDFG
jgi:hypothetical protein